ncbi:MAG: trigger factor [Planctomycetaceae bacterium]|nr:trigger factor [Planctomycetaceae bacterium]
MAEEKTPQPEETEEVKNTVTISDAGPSKKKVQIEIPAETIHEKLDEKYKELRRDAILPGFRKGRAPIRLLEKRFGTDITKQVKLELMAKASEAAMKDNNINSLRDPEIDPDKVELPEEGPMKFEFDVDVRPEFELPELEGIEIEKPTIEVNDARINEQIEEVRKRLGLWVPKEDKAQEGDQIIADVVLVTEGSADKDKRDNVEIFIRKPGFVVGVPVEDLEQILKDVKSGDQRNTTVEVPATYFNEQYRGKKIDIEIAVKEVKRLELAEFNEEFFKRFNVANEAELREIFRERLSSQAERDARTAMTDQIYDYLREHVELDLPEAVVADQSMTLLRRHYSNMLMRGMSKEQIEEQMDQLRASSEEQAKDQLKLYFIMDRIAEKYDITTTEEEINGHIAYVASMRGRRPEKMREELAKDGSLTQFALQVREEKCIEKLLESAKITDVEPGKPAPAAKKTPKKVAAKSRKKEDQPESEDDTTPERKKTAAKRTKKKEE